MERRIENMNSLLSIFKERQGCQNGLIELKSTVFNLDFVSSLFLMNNEAIYY